MRVLFVDDDRDMRECVSMGLGERIELDLASTGAEALKAVSEHQFDAIVLDLLMPDVDGVEVLNYLAVHRSATPVVLASAAPNLYRIATRFNVKACFSKPYSLRALEHCLIELGK